TRSGNVLHLRSGYNRSSSFLVCCAAKAFGYGPKYLPLPFCTFRVTSNRGCSSLVIRIYGKDLSSLRSTLYRGLYFLIILHSNIRASTLLAVTIYSKSRISCTSRVVFAS